MRLTSAALLLLTASSSHALSIGATRRQAIQYPAGSSNCPKGITQDPNVAMGTSLVGASTASPPPSNPAVTSSVLPDPFPILLDNLLSILLSFDTLPSTTPLGDLHSILFPQPSGRIFLPGLLNPSSCKPTPLEPTYIGTNCGPGQSGNPLLGTPTALEPTYSGTSVSPGPSSAGGGSEKPGSAKALSVPLVTLLGAVGLAILL
ncbi:hypothetical protein DFH08DRAFT_1087582 [Mycena albidolilacea]|uniref:Uncharacterized protein n=1 Tax=Mycena albidolilacea TaxID=1033008 RepID=A0AAD7ECL6_9AGAR|nr:hypothetical protein DFH08DRAFT_1087582 [Mycena albidolilacea]